MTDFKKEKETEKEKENDVLERLITGQTFYIVQDGDFNTQQILLLDSITTVPLSDARWALDGSAFIVMFVTGDNPSPLMDAYPVYTNLSIQPIISQYPWVLPF